jgi:glycosyltransferase involved in cell wall biosynthesis
MPLHPIFYIYPLNKWISFHFIAEEHVRELRKYFNVTKVDEKALTVVMPIARLTAEATFLLQPYFYPIQVYERKLLDKIGKPERLIGVDVADSDHITEYAVHLTEYATAMIVPSNFSRNSYINSGVKTPVYVVPHGVPDDYFNPTPSKPNTFKQLYDYKIKNNVKLIQTWCLHSEYRKGLDLAYEIFSQLVKERKDVALVDRASFNINVFDSPIDYKNPQPKFTLTSSWLTDEQIKELMDICDIYLLTSRGGGFEHPPLLALARGEPAIGAKGGAWEDYLPDWALIPSHKSGQVLANNPIHDGYGVEIEVEKAVSALHEILNNLDEYRARVKYYLDTYVKEKFTWTKIGEKLKDIVLKHLTA